MDFSSRSHSPTRSRSPVAKPGAISQRGTSTASGRATREGGTGNALLDHSLRLDGGTRRTDNVRMRGNNNNSSSDSPTTTHDNYQRSTSDNMNKMWTPANANRKNNNNNTTSNTAAPPPPNNGGLRRRAYSWRGEHPPTPPPDRKKPSDQTGMMMQPLEYIPMMNREARSVTVWVLMAALLQLVLSLLTQLASYHHPSYYYDNYWMRIALRVPSIVAGMILELIPTSLFKQTSPGLIYASAWLLMGVRETLGCIPHVPSRICAGVLGRLSGMECALAVTVQMTCTVSTVLILQYCLPEHWTQLALRPLDYTSKATSGVGNPLIVDFFHELMVNTLFTVGLQVLPVLLRLNRASRFWAMLFLYPLYVYAVDGSSGTGSTMSPSILVALSYSHHDPWQLLVRGIAQILSGLTAGKLMQVYFPDDPKNA